jgi:hypothetical protein
MTAPIDNAAMLAARIDLEIKALRIVIDRLELCKSFLAPPTAEPIRSVGTAGIVGGES